MIHRRKHPGARIITLPPELLRIIRTRARKRHISLSQAIIALLKEALGLGRRSKKRCDLDSLAGTWSAKDAKAFEKSLAERRIVDPDLWR